MAKTLEESVRDELPKLKDGYEWKISFDNIGGNSEIRIMIYSPDGWWSHWYDPKIKNDQCESIQLEAKFFIHDDLDEIKKYWDRITWDDESPFIKEDIDE